MSDARCISRRSAVISEAEPCVAELLDRAFARLGRTHPRLDTPTRHQRVRLVDVDGSFGGHNPSVAVDAENTHFQIEEQLSTPFEN
jgi:hypothetical protein